jgi:hypothetical protein
VRSGEGKWFVEDLGAVNGTQIDACEIGGKGAREIEPGMLIRFGDTLCTIVPSHWFTILSGKLFVCFDYSPIIAYVYLHSGIPIVSTFRAANFSTKHSCEARLVLDIADYADSMSVDIPALPHFSSSTFSVPKFQFNITALKQQIEPARSLLKAELHTDGYAARKIAEVTILGFNAWPYEPLAIKTLPAFIFSHDRLVETIIFSAEERLRKTEGIASFSSLLSGDDCGAEKKIVECLYEYLSNMSDIRYVDPHLELPSAGQEQEYQVIRSPSSLFLFEEPQLKGKGTCLDIALLFAACLENIGILPLLILCGRTPFKPEHAFVGYRVGLMPGPVPVTNDRDSILDDIESGNAGVIDSTGIALGYLSQNTLNISGAYKEAKRCLKEYSWVYVIDVGVLRPPEGIITPLEYPYDPDVLKIYEASEAFTRAKGRRSIEARFLLYGCITAQGPAVRELGKEFSGLFSEISESMENNVSCHDYIGPLDPTITYKECQELAREYARQAGCSAIREQDVLWALIEKGKANAGIRRICQETGLDMATLATALEKIHSRPVLLHSSEFSEH